MLRLLAEAFLKSIQQEEQISGLSAFGAWSMVREVHFSWDSDQPVPEELDRKGWDADDSLLDEVDFKPSRKSQRLLKSQRNSQNRQPLQDTQ